jgi:hypothetical protein
MKKQVSKIITFEGEKYRVVKLLDLKAISNYNGFIHISRVGEKSTISGYSIKYTDSITEQDIKDAKDSINRFLNQEPLF